MKVVSLFDGISCGRVAFDRAGIPVESYIASEIHKPSIIIAQKNYPDTKQVGDVLGVKGEDLGEVDILIGGSPCQGFSFAGKQLNFEDPRSKLFFEFVRILKETKPRYFLLENVNMKKEYQDIISGYLGVEPIMINSSLLSAQNRKRLYWTNIPNITQPKDKGILLKDIVHEYADLDTVMSEGWCKWFKEKADYLLTKKYASLDPEKAITMTARQYANWNGNFIMECLSEYIVPFDTALQVLDKEVQEGKMGYFRKDSQANRVYFVHNKAITLCGDAGGGAAKMGQYLFGEVTKNYFQYDLKGKGHGSQDQRAYYLDGKHGTLASTSGGSKCKALFGEIRHNEVLSAPEILDSQRFFTLTNKENVGVLIEGYIRKLTPIEAERLQTLPDGYTAIGSDTQNINLSERLRTIKGGSKCRNVKLKDARGILQVGQQECDTSIIFDFKEMAQQRLLDQLSIKVSDVTLKDATEPERPRLDIVSCTINDMCNTEQLSYTLERLKSVGFVIEMQLLEGCVTNTIKIGRGTETQSIQIKLEQGQMQTDIQKHRDSIELSTEKLFQTYLGETYQNMTLSTILTLINLITMHLIYTCVEDTLNIRLSINNLTKSQGNLLSWELSNLRTEDITLISNAQRYKALGNGWTVDVIAHILSHINKSTEIITLDDIL